MPVASGRRLVGLMLPAGEEFAAALDDAWQRGDAVLPLDPAAPAATTSRVLTAMRPHVVVTPDGVRPTAAGRPVDDDVVLVVATSGSTGEPKGAQLTAAALEASARATLTRLGRTPADRWLACLPWHHIGGLQVLLRARLFGAAVEVHARFDVSRVAASSATLVSLVPTQLLRLLDAGVDLRGFRAVLLGGAAAPPELLARAGAAGVRVVTTYGMSETAGGCVYDGRPLDGVQVRLDGAGRVLLRGPMLMTGYRLRPDLTREALVDGWLRTADLGTLADGRLTVHGRVDDVIVTGGENVVATAVAELLAGHPAVADAAVTGLPDETWGRRVVAVVAATGPAPSLEELRAWVAARAPVSHAPRQLVVVDAVPRLPSGKPDRLAVERLARERSAGDGRHHGRPSAR